VAVRIRLTRVGATKQPTYRFVVSDSRNARDGRSLDTLGHYNPRTNPIEINVDENKAKDWMSRGAKPSDTVARLFRRVGVLPEEAAPVRPAKAPKAKAQAKAAAAKAAAEAPPTPAPVPAPAEEAVAEAPAEDAVAEAPAEEAVAEAPAEEAAEAPAEETAEVESSDTAEAETAETASAEEE